MPVDKFGRMSDTKTKDTGVSLTYINNNYIRSDGTTPVSGSINMNGNTLYNVPDQVNPHDAATTEYADNKRPHIITVHTHYYGPLHKGKYQFTFGGNIYYPHYSGFLVPHSGRIKKIASRVDVSLPEPVSLFSFMITKKDEYTQTRLADYIVTKRYDVITEEEEKEKDLAERGGLILPSSVSARQKVFFDNDLENYPLSEGDLINIKTMVDLA